MNKNYCAFMLLICFIFSGCFAGPLKKVTSDPKQEKKVISDKWEWKVKDGRLDMPIRNGGVDLKFNFIQVDLKQVVTLLMQSIHENFVIVDALNVLVDVEIDGKFKREEVIKMVRTILNSKNFDLIKNGAIYGIYDRTILEESETVLEIDLDKNVYLYHLQFAKSENLMPLLNDIFPEISVTENRNINLLVIKSSIEDYKKVTEVIHRFDKRPKQVLVEFTIMEVTLSDALKYGVEYFFKNNDERGGNMSLLADGLVSGSAPVIGKGLKAFAFRNDLNTFITVLKSVSNVDIVSKPHVLVQDGKTSVIKIGREEPIRRGTAVSENGQVSENIDYRDVGVILSVSIDVEENNVVKLKLNQEVSDIIQTSENPLIDSPSFTQNNITLNTLLNDGQSIFIGGLIENSTVKSENKIPYLGDIPYLGKIFRSEDISNVKKELILLLSVEILHNEKDFETQKLKFRRTI